jgi:hypothetical protein
MDRRAFVSALACWPAVPLLAQDRQDADDAQDGQQPRFKLSAAQVAEALSARFPVRFGIPGIAQVEVSSPQLLLLPTRNKLGATLHARASGSGVGPVQSGLLDLVFALRYERKDRSIRAHQPEILRIDWPGLTAEGAQALQLILPDMAREVAAELVLHRFTARELALPDTMGFEPGTVTVAEDGVVVAFRQKQTR